MKKIFHSFYQNLIIYRLHVAIAFVLLAIFSAFYVLITAPNNFVFTEQLQYWAYGNATVKYAVLHYGQLGLWDIHNGLGYSLIGHMSSQFYPITILGFFIPNDLLSIRLQVFLHLLLAGVSFFYLLSVLKVRIPARVLGSICFVVNDYVYFVVYRGFLTETYNLVWMTLSVAFLWQALFKKKPLYAILCGIALAMHVIAMISYTLYFTGIILIFLTFFYFLYQRAYKREQITKTFIFLGKTIGIIVITFFGISAIKLLPVLQYSWYSTRTSYPLYKVFVPGTWELATLDSLAHYVTNFLIPQGQVPLKYGFAIILTFLANTLFFILLLYSFAKKSKEIVFFWMLTFFMFWAAMGKHAILDLYKIFYYTLPGIKTLNYPQRLFIITNLALPLLASFGFDVMWQNIKRFRYIHYIILAFILAPIILYVRAQMLHYIAITPDHRTFHPHNIFAQQVTNLGKQDASPYHVLSTYFQDSKTVGSYTAIYHNFLLANPPLESFQLSYQHMPLYSMISHIPTDDFLQKKYKYIRLMNIKYNVTSENYDDHATQYKTLLFTQQNHNREDGSIYQIKNPNPYLSTTPFVLLFVGNNTKDFNSLKVKSLVLSKDFDIQKYSIFSTNQNINSLSLSQFNGIIFDDSVSVPNNLKGIPTLQLHFSTNNYSDIGERSDSIFYKNPAVYLSASEQKKFDTFLQKFDFNSQNSSLQNNTFQIKLLSLTPENIIFSVITQKTIPVTIADMYFPNWSATIDTKKTSVFMADGLLKGVLIPQGKHVITLEFTPIFFYIGSGITGISVLTLLLYLYKKIKKK